MEAAAAAYELSVVGMENSKHLTTVEENLRQNFSTPEISRTQTQISMEICKE